MRDVSALLKKLLDEAKEAEESPEGGATSDRSMLNQYSPGGIQIAEVTGSTESKYIFLNAPKSKGSS